MTTLPDFRLLYCEYLLHFNAGESWRHAWKQISIILHFKTSLFRHDHFNTNLLDGRPIWPSSCMILRCIWRSLVSAVFVSPWRTSIWRFNRSYSLACAWSARFISYCVFSSSLRTEFLACAMPIWITAPEVSFSALIIETCCLWYLSSLTTSIRTFSRISRLPLRVIASLSRLRFELARNGSSLSELLRESFFM